MTEKELSKEAQEVVAVALAVAEAVDRHDLDAVLQAQYHGPECCVILPDAPAPFRGWAAVRHALERKVEEFTHSRTRIEDPRVSLFGEWAVLTYHKRIDGRIHDIDFTWIGWVTEVLIRKEGRWLTLHYHASDVYRPEAR